jgi:hypothetical protein
VETGSNPSPARRFSTASRVDAGLEPANARSNAFGSDHQVWLMAWAVGSGKMSS